jgi:hypothetical protein
MRVCKEADINSDYSDLGLNQFLTNKNSPLSNSNNMIYAQVNSNIEALGASSISTGVFRNSIGVGGAGTIASIRLDGQNGRIIINDGTVDRVIIGSL